MSQGIKENLCSHNANIVFVDHVVPHFFVPLIPYQFTTQVVDTEIAVGSDYFLLLENKGNSIDQENGEFGLVRTC